MVKKHKIKKYYVVWIGRETGVFGSWEEAKRQICGFSGAMFKSYECESTAKYEYRKGCPTPDKQEDTQRPDNGRPDFECITVDGAYSSATKKMEYQCVMNISGEKVFGSRPLTGGTQNIAEFLALVGAIKYRSANKLYDMPIYTDSNTALAWLRNRRVNTTANLDKSDPLIAQRLENAIDYLYKCRYPHKHIRKWDTAAWGEIPADFDRK
jgi:ribonuclease HI